MCNAIRECDMFFSPGTIFPTKFSDGVFKETCAHRSNRSRGSVTNHNHRRKGEIIILVHLLYGLLANS